LETKCAFTEIVNNWDSLTFDQKEAKRQNLIPQFGLATGCIIEEGKIDETQYFDEGQEGELIKVLDSFDLIVGHNVLDFDFLVLSPYYDSDTINHFRPKTLDALDYLKKITGRYISLDELAQLNIGEKKTMNGADAPKLWRSEKRDIVRAYCKNDVELLRKVYLQGKKK